MTVIKTFGKKPIVSVGLGTQPGDMLWRVKDAGVEYASFFQIGAIRSLSFSGYQLIIGPLMLAVTWPAQNSTVFGRIAKGQLFLIDQPERENIVYQREELGLFGQAGNPFSALEKADHRMSVIGPLTAAEMKQYLPLKSPSKTLVFSADEKHVGLITWWKGGDECEVHWSPDKTRHALSDMYLREDGQYQLRA